MQSTTSATFLLSAELDSFGKTIQMHPLIQKLSDAGWKVEANGTAFKLLPTLNTRYPKLPTNLSGILNGLNSCTSKDEKSWLLCLSDYSGSSDSAFAWNEFEIQSLETASDNEEWSKEIKDFWNQHFPIYISVKDGYSYAAISLSDETFGQIVYGEEPEYETCSPVAHSLENIIEQLKER